MIWMRNTGACLPRFGRTPNSSNARSSFLGLPAILAAVEAIEGVKKPTIKKFKRELAKLRGRGETFA
eukprot:COSAG04_NODE_3649_length_2639_cov_1.785827_2_plen_67_part_00